MAGLHQAGPQERGRASVIRMWSQSPGDKAAAARNIPHDGGDLRNAPGASYRVVRKTRAEVVGVRGKNVLPEGERQNAAASTR